ETESFENWARLFNFSNGKIKPKVMCIGNNFQHDFESEYEKYRPYLERLDNLFDVIMPRDTYSTDNLKTILKKKDKILQGLDPAFLLKKPDVLEHKATSNNSFAYFFSRSSLPDIQKIVEALEKKSGLKGIELSDWLKLDPDNAEKVFSNCINIITNSAFVLTDLYHLSINTLRLNIPVICFGNETTEQTGTIGDFKKKVLFDMLAMNHLYVELPSDPTRAFEIINNKLYDIANDPKLTLEINYEKIERLIDDFSATILEQISSST
ncbi:hypothetical protein AAY72_05510, partial [Alishewanella sp. WH16-1]|uniref:polysaccharide pyruvyl transferase family protein n=1 Tax=Alishewanella sp. WH16-1 TaxID=1651088 RepID=UPI0007260089